MRLSGYSGFFLPSLITVSLFYLPFSTERIRQFAQQEITLKGGQKIKLTELSNVELDALERLAQSNREGTDKRLVPTAIVLGILQLIGWDWFIRFWSWLWGTVIQLMNLKDPLSLLYLIAGAAIGYVLALAFVLLRSFVTLFSNLVAQSTIIETCILLRYSKETQKLRMPK